MKVIIIQARVGSTRLPGKVILKIGKKTLIEHIISRVKLSKKADKVVLAIPDDYKNDILFRLAKKADVFCTRGDEKNVLGRYIKAAEETSADVIVRITGDCPLIDPRIIDDMLDYFEKEKCDYLLNDVEMGGYSRGFDVDIFSSNALKKMEKLVSRNYHKEHITTFMIENHRMFSIKYYKAPENFRRPNYRLCVDEANDLRLVRKIFDHFSPRGNFSAADIIAYLDDNPKIASINGNVKQKNILKNRPTLTPDFKGKQFRSVILKEIKEIIRSKPLPAEKDWDLIWVLSGPEDEIEGVVKNKKRNETKDRIETAFKIAIQVVSARLNKENRDITIKDIISSGPVVFYNGDNKQNDIFKNVLDKFCQEHNFPKEKVVISDNFGIKNTRDQIAKIPLEILKGKRKIIIVSDAYHLPRVKRYVSGIIKKIGPVRIIFYPAEPKKAPNKKVIQEVNKIQKYIKKRILPPENNR